MRLFNRSSVALCFLLRNMRAPEWALLVLSLGAWLALALVVGRSDLPLLCLSSPNWLARIDARLDVYGRSEVLMTEMLAWLTMVVAMMFPLLLHPVRHVALRSFRHRRIRSIGGFLVGYMGLWLAAGIAASGML